MVGTALFLVMVLLVLWAHAGLSWGLLGAFVIAGTVANFLVERAASHE